MRRHHDTRRRELVRAHIKIHHIITRWGARPQWGVTSIFIVMGAIQAQAPDAASKELVHRYTFGLIERKESPRYIINELWTLHSHTQQYGWS